MIFEALKVCMCSKVHMKRGMGRSLELMNAGSASPSDNHVINVEKVKP